MKSAFPSAPPRSRRPAPKPWLAPLLLVVGLVLLGALAVDLSRMHRAPRRGPDVEGELEQIRLGLNGPRYQDPEDRFSIVPPAGWKIVKPPDCHPYHVAFRGPNGANLNIMATAVDYDDLPSLMKDIEKSERIAGMALKPEAFFFQGRPAVRRMARLTTSRVLCVDFVRQGMAHHILGSFPPEPFDRYYPVLMDVLKTYRPGPAAGAEEAPSSDTAARDE